MVCLPSLHKGGELAVRHDGREIKFDWSNDSTSVQWAAFYSDCEHEVLQVTEGYRVTLTYNLYYNNHGRQIPKSVNWHESTLPLYQSFAQVLQSKEFMPNGKAPPPTCTMRWFADTRQGVFLEFIVIIIMRMRQTLLMNEFLPC